MISRYAEYLARLLIDPYGKQQYERFRSYIIQEYGYDHFRFTQQEAFILMMDDNIQPKQRW